MRLNLTLEPTIRVEPVNLSSYCLGNIEVKMFGVDEFIYVVTQIDRGAREGKSILCLSYEHANYVMEGCIERLREWVN